MARTKAQKEADAKYEAKRAGTRARYWTFIAYPDSAPTNWLQVLKDEQISFVASPIHDRDINEDGSVKKPHYHVLILFDNNKTAKQAEEIAKMIGGTIPISVKDKNNLVRYFSHVDRPEKAQYSSTDIVSYGKVATDLVDEAYALSATERAEIMVELYQWIEDNDIRYYSDVQNYALRHNAVWFREMNNVKTGISTLVHRFILSRSTKAKELELLQAKEQADAEYNAWENSLKQSKTTE